MARKLNRYHQDIYFPELFNESIEEFISGIIETGPMTFSLHSVDKLIISVNEYGMYLWKNFINIVRNNLLNKKNVFEYYTDKENNIKKACFRYAIKNLPIDLIIVVSDAGVIITVFPINSNDTHNTLNKNLYTKE